MSKIVNWRAWTVVLLVGFLFVGQLVWPAHADEKCPVTAPTEEKPADKNTASFSPRWYRSPGGQIFASAGGHLYAGDNKVLWAKPSGSTLRVSGRRIDGEASPMIAHLPDGYPGEYQASGLTFPTGGCWEIEAQAEQTTFRFTVMIYPRIYRYLTAPSCQGLTDVIQNSDLIVYGQLEGALPALEGFTWQTIRATKILKGTTGDEKRIDLLEDDAHEPKLAPGKTYLFFLDSPPGYPWRLSCGPYLFAEVSGERLSGEFWEKTIETVAAFEALLHKTLATPDH